MKKRWEVKGSVPVNIISFALRVRKVQRGIRNWASFCLLGWQFATVDTRVSEGRRSGLEPLEAVKEQTFCTTSGCLVSCCMVVDAHTGGPSSRSVLRRTHQQQHHDFY